ncbi:coiled-coil domain-containing protein 80, partial [Ornithorhynchus anatinus]
RWGRATGRARGARFPSGSGSPNVLAGFAGKSRVWVISAPDASEGYYRLMMSLLKDDVYCELAERHVQQIVLLHAAGRQAALVRRISSEGRVLERPLDPGLVPALMGFLRLEPGKFGMVLLKKTLQVDERYPYPVRLEALYELIDRGPVRKIEKIRQKGFVQKCKAAGVEGQVVADGGPGAAAGTGLGTGTGTGTGDGIGTGTGTGDGTGTGTGTRAGPGSEHRRKEVPRRGPAPPAGGGRARGPGPASTTTTTGPPRPVPPTQRATTLPPAPPQAATTSASKPPSSGTAPAPAPTTQRAWTARPAAAWPAELYPPARKRPPGGPRRPSRVTDVESSASPPLARSPARPPDGQPYRREPSPPPPARAEPPGRPGAEKGLPKEPQGRPTGSEHGAGVEGGGRPPKKQARPDKAASAAEKKKKKKKLKGDRPDKLPKGDRPDKKVDKKGKQEKERGKKENQAERGGGPQPASKRHPPKTATDLLGFFEGKRRLILITAPSAENHMYVQQRDEYLESFCKMATRRISVITVFGPMNNGTMKIDHFQLDNEKPMKVVEEEDLVDQHLINELRKEYGMTYNDFFMVLTDTDTRVKQYYEVPIAMKSVFDLIDTFQSRIKDMEKQKKEGIFCKENKKQSLENFLSRFRWRRRLLVISAPNDEDWAYSQQLSALTGQACNFGLRHITVLKLLGLGEDVGGVLELFPINGSATVDREDVPAHLVKDIRNYFQVSPEYFSMLLVGKDGNVKSWYPSPMWSMVIVYDLIDSMQLRRQEMAIQQSLGMRCPEDEYAGYGYHGYHQGYQDGYQDDYRHHDGYPHGYPY